MTRYETVFEFDGFKHMGYTLLTTIPGATKIRVVARRARVEIISVGRGVVGEEVGALEISGQLNLNPGDASGEGGPFYAEVRAYDPQLGADRRFRLENIYLTNYGGHFLAASLIPWTPAPVPQQLNAGSATER